MELLRSKTTFPILNHLCDESVLYVLVENQGLHLLTFDLHSFEFVASYPVYVPINHDIRWCVDQDRIYLPTLEGQVLAIDKFSGDRLASMDMGSMIVVADLEHDDDHVYSLCGVPLSNGIKINLQTYALCQNYKNSGKKLRQSQCIEGKKCSFLLDTYIWTVFGKNLLVFDLEFNKQARYSLSFTPWQPLATDSFICLSSAFGSLEVFRKSNIQCIMRKIIAHQFPPINIGEDHLCCITKGGIYKFDLQKGKSDLISNRSIDASHGAVACDDVIFASNQTGVCTKYRIGGGVDVIDLQKPCAKPICFDGKIILISADSIHEVV